MKIRTRLGLGFGIQVLLTAVLGLSVLYGMDNVRHKFSQVVEIDAPVMANARQLSKLVVDMETGQRGFCITQNEAFLEPYINGSRDFEQLINLEKQLVIANPDQVAILERIEDLVNQWQEKAAKPEIAMARKVALRTIDADHFQDVLGRGVGKGLMDRFMTLAHQLELSFSQRADWEGAFVVEIIEKCMTDREDGQRGFLITGREEFLDKYLNGEQEGLSDQFARLRAIISDRGRNEELAETVNQLEALAQQWDEQAAIPEINARRVMNNHPESFKNISALLEAGTGKNLIDEIRSQFDQFIETERRHATLSYHSASETTANTKSVAVLLLVLALGLGTFVALAISRAVTKPLTRLVCGVEAIGSGHLETRIEEESGGEIRSLIGAFNTMATDLQHSRKKLEIAATTDKLTGLPNRTLFLDRLEEALSASKSSRNQFAVLFFDFDRFKVVNDSLGHEVGDTLLCEIGNTFCEELGPADTVARIGGDEFIVLLNHLQDWDEAQIKAHQLLSAFSKPHQLGEHLVVSNASIGLVTNERDYEVPGDMIRDADAAMYRAKENGRAQVVIFDQAMHANALERLSLEADLHNAIDRDELRLVYQPIVELDTGQVAGFEALIRWQHPQRGLISPLEFIPIAEDTGLIVSIGNWVLHQAAAQIASWDQNLEGRRNLKININVSKRQLLAPSYLDEILACQREYRLRFGMIQLEITESTIADERCEMVPLLQKLREHGFRIAMDDFGTGVSSLSALHEYPIDVLKIDQAFIRVLDSDRSLLAVVASITNLAENLGIHTVAEGIESADIVGALQSIGCTWGQGYYFGKPLDVDDAEEYLRQHFQSRKLPAA